MRTVTLAVAAFFLLSACGKDENKEEDVKDIVLPPPQDVFGTPFEPVLETQSQLARIFDPEVTGADTAEAILSMARTFEEQKLEQFKKDCRSMVDHFQADPAHKVLLWADYGRRWQEISSMIRTRSTSWAPGQKEVVKMTLEAFTCR